MATTSTGTSTTVTATATSTSAASSLASSLDATYNELPSCAQTCTLYSFSEDFPIDGTDLVSLCDASGLVSELASACMTLNPVAITSTTSSPMATGTDPTLVTTSSSSSLTPIEIVSIVIGCISILCGLFSGFKIARAASQLTEARKKGQLFTFYSQKTKLGVSRIVLYYIALPLSIASWIVSIALMIKFGFTGPSQALSIVSSVLTIVALGVLYPGREVKGASSLPVASTDTGNSFMIVTADQETTGKLVDKELRRAAGEIGATSYAVATDESGRVLDKALSVPVLIAGHGSTAATGANQAGVSAGTIGVGIGIVAGSCLALSLVSSAGTVLTAVVSSASITNKAATGCTFSKFASCCNAISVVESLDVFDDVLAIRTDSACFAAWKSANPYITQSASCTKNCVNITSPYFDEECSCLDKHAYYSAFADLVNYCPSFTSADANALDLVANADCEHPYFVFGGF
ncbi:hypothetical protein HK405_012462 [Cladochytrium tenue]|nr:hypothetical protein HK405_012462 [Cladochytrium tenue]